MYGKWYVCSKQNKVELEKLVDKNVSDKSCRENRKEHVFFT